jgi:hypothetical protein
MESGALYPTNDFKQLQPPFQKTRLEPIGFREPKCVPLYLELGTHESGSIELICLSAAGRFSPLVEKTAGQLGVAALLNRPKPEQLPGSKSPDLICKAG